jgi:hypothetical protein
MNGVRWSDDIDEVISGDLTAAAAFLTPAGGAVVTGVAPCGVRDRSRGVVSFTTSLGFEKKLERIITNPRVALAFHAREHGFSTSPRFVLVQGIASVDLVPSRPRINAMIPQAEHYLGEVKRGWRWDKLLRVYYRERVFVDIEVLRITAWPNLAAAGPPEVSGRPLVGPPVAQGPPRNGTPPRVAVDKASNQIAVLPHRVLAFRGGDGLPTVIPVSMAGHDSSGLRLVCSPGLLPPGARRAGLLAHSYRPQLVGLSTRTYTGWLDVGEDGTAVYSPHTSKGFRAPPRKTLLLVSNGLLAKYQMRHAQRVGVLEQLQQRSRAAAAAESSAATTQGADFSVEAPLKCR